MMRKRMFIALGITLTAFTGLHFGSQSASAETWKIEEKIVGPAPEAGTIYTLSPKGMHFAVVYMKGSRFVVSIDGVAEEKFDEILHAAVGVNVRYYSDGLDRMISTEWRGPVAFSPDGSRYAYAARQGKEAVVILDGKEIFRAPYQKANPPLIRTSVSLLSFTPDGKHLFFYEHTGQLIMDGQAVTPKLKKTPWLFFSTDGSRWGLLAEPVWPFNALSGVSDGGAFMTLLGKYVKQSEKAHRKVIFIDGKAMAYTCRHPRFTLDGRHVVCTQHDNGKQSLLLDGKPIMTVNRINNLALSPNGDIAIIASDNGGKKRLYIGGKPVPGGEDAFRTIFSPDGKRWAAVCRSGSLVWVVADGKKQMEYDYIDNVAFTPDTSKIVYIAKSGEKKFVVVNGEEDHGAQSIRFGPMFGKTGNHVSYAVQSQNKLKVYHDGKVTLKSSQVTRLTVSPDGARYAYYDETGISGRLNVDGEVKGGGAGYPRKIVFSPDSQHIAAMSSRLPGGSQSIYRDGRFVPLPKGMRDVRVLGFSSDSQHLLMKGSENTRRGAEDVYFLDGKRIANFHFISHSWEMQPDGGVVLIGHETSDHKGGVVKRIKVTP